MTRPRISIGTLSGNGLVCHKYAVCLAGLVAFTAQRFPLAITEASSSTVANSRNNCVKAALEQKADWLFMVDSDMVFPHDGLVRLMAHERAIVGGVYPRRGSGEILGLPLGFDPRHDYTGVNEMEHLATGFILIRMDVFADLPKPWFRTGIEGEETVTEDVQFCRDVRAAGWKVWADMDIPLGHIDQTVLTCPTTM